MTENKFKNIKSIILLLVISSLLVYVFLRAYYLSFTHDESFSFKIITGDNEPAKTANNHFINTWLMYVFYHLFGAKEIALRLPNVLAFIMYSFFSYKILMKASNIFLMLLGASFLFLNPYLLDFFSLARGYGLSLGFGLGALYFLFKQDRFTTYKEYIISLSLSLFFSLLSAYSILICINLNITLLIVFLIELILLIKNKTIQLNKKRISIVLLIFILNLVFLVVLINRLLILKDHNELYIGGSDNFISDTLTVLIHQSIYFGYYGELFWIKIRQIIVAIFVIAIVYQIFYKKYSPLLKITAVLFLMVSASILQHYLFDVLYPLGRTSLIFIPLFALLVYFFLSDIYNKFFSKQYLKVIYNLSTLLLLCLPLGWHFINNINLKYTKDWKYDSCTKDMIQNIIGQHKTSIYEGKTISISNTWLFEPSINYYRFLYSMDYLSPANRNGIDKNTDFIYCTKEEKENLISNTTDCYTILCNYEEAETALLKKSICK